MNNKKVKKDKKDNILINQLSLELLKLSKTFEKVVDLVEPITNFYLQHLINTGEFTLELLEKRKKELSEGVDLGISPIHQEIIINTYIGYANIKKKIEDSIISSEIKND